MGRARSTSASSNVPITAEMIEKIIKSQLLNMKLELKQAIDDNFKMISDRLLVTENDIRLIKSEWAELKKSTVKVDNKGDLNDIISELEERNLRNSNVLLFNIPESKASELANKIHDDIQKVTSVLVHFRNPRKFFVLV